MHYVSQTFAISSYLLLLGSANVLNIGLGEMWLVQPDG